jgi:plastocyanin
VRASAVIVLVVLAGCGSAKLAATSAPTPAAVVPVAMRDIKFVPARVTVTVGQTVHWTNQEKVTHTVASAALKIASEGIAGGQSYEYRATKPGTFPDYCTIHAGQSGVLVVRPR